MKKRSKFLKRLYENNFVSEAVQLSGNLAVYRTDRGPIFAVFAPPGVIKGYIRDGGIALAKLHCSYDLRQEPTADQAALFEAQMADVFKRPDYWTGKIYTAVGKLMADR